jgi:hypothetical protein
LLIPQQYLGTFGISIEGAALPLAHIYGATALMMAVTVWSAKDAAPSDGRRAILLGCLAGNILAALVAIIDLLGGLLPPIGWANAVLFTLFAAGFAYFIIMKPENG